MDVEKLIQQTSDKLLQRAAIKENKDTEAPAQTDGLMFLGNPHDTVPRRLLLDQYLSPRDKYAWQIIRFKAEDSSGAVFPSYDELQIHLANRPIDEKASRSTVSRTLLMLRLTRWLSLCHKARDSRSGRILGNVYALHDEPLSVLDALRFDASYLQLLDQCVRHENKTIRATAMDILHDIKSDTRLRYLTSRMALIDERVEWQHKQISPSANQQTDQAPIETRTSKPSLDGISGQKMPGTGKVPGFSQPGTKSVPSLKSEGYPLVSKQNPYVRTLQKDICKSTTDRTPEKQPVLELDWPKEILATSIEQQTVRQAMAGLSQELCHEVLNDTAGRVMRGGIQNPLAYLLATIRKAHEGQFNQFVREGISVQHQSFDDDTIKNKIDKNKTTHKDMSKLINEIRVKCQIQN